MFGWAITFLLLSLVAAFLGFYGLTGLAALLVKFLLIVFVFLLVASAGLSLVVTNRHSSRHFRAVKRSDG
jgi:uncharacterized membrane protein YtjA (UPF0391 family)